MRNAPRLRAEARLLTEVKYNFPLHKVCLLPFEGKLSRCTSADRSRLGVRDDGTRADAGRIQDNGSV